MHLDHIGIMNKSEDDAVRFYGELLGLELLKRSVLPAALSVQLFGLERDVDIIVFAGEGLKVEIFICPEGTQPQPDFNHPGLHLDDLQGFIQKAGQAGAELVIGTIPGKTGHFIRDFSGNLLEIKQS